MKILQLHADFIEYKPIKKEIPSAEEAKTESVREEEILVLFTAVEDGDDGASEVGCERGACRNQAANDYDEVGAQKRLAIGRRLYHSQAAKMVRHH